MAMTIPEIIKKTKQSIALVIASLDEENKQIITGSGFVFSKCGIIVTCNHVVKKALRIILKFPDTGFIPGVIAINDPEHDLALIKFSDDTRPPIPLGDLDEVVEGMRVIFSGYPLESQDLTTHQGILSAIITDASGIKSYAIDGTVNSGNSGCPLMDNKGRVIGVVNATRRMRADLLAKVSKMDVGALSLHGVDIVEIYQALINNVQLGVGHAVPASYIPERKNGKKTEDGK